MIAGDTTLEQQVQRRANAVQKLSRRINGDMKAKQELATSLSAWAITISQHLVGLVGRVRALSQKVDEDLSEAVTEMQTALRDQPSASSADQVAAAMAAMGPVWTAGQEDHMYKLAAGLRAFGTVTPATPPVAVTTTASTLAPTVGVATGAMPHFAAPRGPEVMSGGGHGEPLGTVTEAHFGGFPANIQQPSDDLAVLMGYPAELGGPAAVPAAPARRWRQKRSTGGSEHRPSKSPRREVAHNTDPPWTTTSTGRTPEAVRRPAGMVVETEDELIPDRPRSPHLATPSWYTGWLFVMQFAVEQGREAISKLAQHPEQDASLPLQHNPVLADGVLEAAQALWVRLQQVVSARDEGSVPALLAQMQTFLQQVRTCPLILPRLPQGLLLAVQASLGHLLDPFSFAPSTAQEWLFPGLLLEHGGPFLGFVPTGASADAHVQMMLHLPPPGTVSASPSADGTEFHEQQDLDAS